MEKAEKNNFHRQRKVLIVTTLCYALTSSTRESENQEPQSVISYHIFVATQRSSYDQKGTNLSLIKHHKHASSSPLIKSVELVLEQPFKDPFPMSIKKLNCKVFLTFLEEKRLSTDGLIYRYPEISSCTINFRFPPSIMAHIFWTGFESFIPPMETSYHRGRSTHQRSNHWTI